MTKFKRLMALAAVSMLGIQLMGVGTAFAAGQDSDCDFGSDSLEVTLGTSDGPDDGEAYIYVDDNGMLVCDSGSTGEVSQAASTIDSLTVVMDDDDSTGELTIYLDDDNSDAAEWPNFDTFDIDVTTTLIVDGSSVGTGAANDLSVKFGKDTFSFSGTNGTYAASGIEFYGGDANNALDASKAEVKVYAEGGSDDDVLKGGTKNDYLDGNGCDDGDILYGNAGNDYLYNDWCDGDQAWGGEGNDSLEASIVAPGAGNDDVCADVAVSYADLTAGMEWVEGDTAGSAGDDEFNYSGCSGAPDVVSLTQGDDLFVDYTAMVKGNGGDDVIKTTGDAQGGAGDDFIAAYDDGGEENSFYGNAGNDVLRGKSGDDLLRGGPGSDQAWGANGSEDTCNAEVENRCELSFT